MEAATIVKPERLTYSVAEAAELVGVSTSRMYQLVKTTGFPAVCIGRRVRVSKKGLERWVEEQAEKGWAGCEDYV